MAAESYSVAEAALIIGRSEKRVRQLLAEGVLQAVPSSRPIRVYAEGVHRQRELRKGSAPTASTSEGLEALLAAAAALTRPAIEAERRAHEDALAARDRVEVALRESLAAAQARAVQAEAKLAELEAATSKAKRKRRKAKGRKRDKG